MLAVQPAGKRRLTSIPAQAGIYTTLSVPGIGLRERRCSFSSFLACRRAAMLVILQE